MNSSSEGILFDIQRFSLVDGPGIRTTVFLKGCPLQCKWCHNPESQTLGMRPFTCRQSCTCGSETLHVRPPACVPTREQLLSIKGTCPSCGQTHTLQPRDQAGRYFGWKSDVHSVIAEVEKDRNYFEDSGGGLTLSGGEPMTQHRFATALFKSASASGIHTCLDTSGCAPLERFKRINPYVDLYHLDWKANREEDSRLWTGASNKPVRQLLDFLEESCARVRLRCPLIPDVNDHPENFATIGKLQQLKCVESVDLLPYHPNGEFKNECMGLSTHLFSTPTQSDYAKWNQLVDLYLDQSRTHLCQE